jgi:hypothetical protein
LTRAPNFALLPVTIEFALLHHLVPERIAEEDNLAKTIETFRLLLYARGTFPTEVVHVFHTGKQIVLKGQVRQMRKVTTKGLQRLPGIELVVGQ